MNKSVMALLTMLYFAGVIALGSLVIKELKAEEQTIQQQSDSDHILALANPVFM